MGTNYYTRTPGCPNACDHCAESTLLHLGKSSAGWRFLHRADPDWPRDRAHELWLDRARAYPIEDEYGRPVSVDELLARIEAKRDGRSHMSLNPETRRFLGAALYDSLAASDFESDGHDFCDRAFS